MLLGFVDVGGDAGIPDYLSFGLPRVVLHSHFLLELEVFLELELEIKDGEIELVVLLSVNVEAIQDFDHDIIVEAEYLGSLQ